MGTKKTAGQHRGGRGYTNDEKKATDWRFVRVRVSTHLAARDVAASLDMSIQDLADRAIREFVERNRPPMGRRVTKKVPRRAVQTVLPLRRPVGDANPTDTTQGKLVSLGGTSGIFLVLTQTMSLPPAPPVPPGLRGPPPGLVK